MTRVRTATIAAIFGGAAVLSGCGEKEKPPPPPPAEVTVSQPIQEEVQDFVEFTGNTEAYESNDVVARVKGYLRKVNFSEGEMVKKDDLLYEIEPELYQAELDIAKAAKEAAEASLKRANADLGIKQKMLAGNAASLLDVIQAEAVVSTATAEVDAAKARIEQATVNLGYTKVHAHISGKISKTRVDAGNLVGSNGDQVLTDIVQADPIYANFYVDEATVLRFQARWRKQGIDLTKDEGKPKPPLWLATGDMSEFPYKGKVDYVNNKVDESTGTLSLRGILDNKNHDLTPGLFVRVRIPDGDPYHAILVPDRAIGDDQGQKYVFVVNDKNTVEYRPVVLGTLHGRLRVIAKGVAAGEWIITDGLLRTRQGATVSPKRKPLSPDELNPTTMPAATRPAP